MHRRQFVRVAALPAFLPLASLVAAESKWPTHQVTWVSVSAAGGNSDVVSRAIAQHLSERLKVPVVVENKPGASGGIASAFVAKAPADGYTVLAGSIASHVIYPLIAKSLFDPERDFAPVALLGSNSNVLVVPTSSPYRTVDELLSAARRDPGSISYGSPGIGSSQHMSGELLQKLSGVKLTHVPNVRGSAITDVMAGHISMTFDGASLLPQMQSGRLRALAVTSRKRWAQLPEVPTMEEAGVKGFEVSSWQGLYAPAGTPRPIIEMLNREILAVLKLPQVVASFQQMGLVPGQMTGAEFADFQKSEIGKWRAVVKDAGIKAG
jgi:tripartite-type tricarboxylate transporter receptor subunit TctC